MGTYQNVHKFTDYCDWLALNPYMSFTDWLEAKSTFERLIGDCNH